MSPPPALSRYLESSLVKLSYLKVAQALVERVVGDSRGRDRCGCRVCVKARVRGLSQELVFLGEALGLGPAVPSRGHPAKEHCSCLRGSMWLWALQSGCRLVGSCARLLPGTPRDCSACRPGASGRRALGEGGRVADE
uniref:Uncharacterized protein n=1 Tax=Pipistrellus kuhlii TaxID=59472 RepID=A0A7J8B1V0_PIPKU|nr:hypothetical protein mPipKuh1_007650 [Pipistrellus kuhlii]